MLSEKEFKHLSFLARLDPDDPALQATRLEFNSILDYIDIVQKLDTKTLSNQEQANLKPAQTSIQRRDIPQAVNLSPTQIGAFAPRWEAGHFVVPGIIESES